MKKNIKKYMKMMQSGQITDLEAAKILNMSLNDIHKLFAKFNTDKKRKSWFFREFIYSFDLNVFIRLLNFLFKK